MSSIVRVGIDYHLHTARCGHASGAIRDYVRRAVDIGLSEIGFADHLPLLDGRDPTLTMSVEDLPSYLEEIELLRSEFPEIVIKAGIEADFFPGQEKRTAELLGAYPFDYVIGSIHFLGPWGFDDPRGAEGYEGRQPLEVYEEYFSALIEAVESRLFDVIAHPDLIKKYDYRAGGDIAGLYRSAASAIGASGAAVEVNTAGLRKPIKEIYPTLDFLKLCCEAGAPVVFGSDAHRPEDVGVDFDEAARLALEAGYERIATFTRRRLAFADFTGRRIEDEG